MPLFFIGFDSRVTNRLQRHSMLGTMPGGVKIAVSWQVMNMDSINTDTNNKGELSGIPLTEDNW